MFYHLAKNFHDQAIKMKFSFLFGTKTSICSMKDTELYKYLD